VKDLAMHILDILQNSLRAGATRIGLEVNEESLSHRLTFTITDNGKGMSEETRTNATDPFFTSRTTRRIGMGLPLLKQNAEQTGGHVSIESEEGKGTQVTALFHRDHIDCPALGDLVGTVVMTVTSNPGIEFNYHHRKDGLEFVFNSGEIKSALDGVGLNDPAVYPLLCEMVTNNLSEMNVDLTT